MPDWAWALIAVFILAVVVSALVVAALQIGSTRIRHGDDVAVDALRDAFLSRASRRQVIHTALAEAVAACKEDQEAEPGE